MSASAKLVLLSLSLLPVQNAEELQFRWKLADSIVSVTENGHYQRVLMSIARWESNYIERLSSPNCECRKNECDNGRAKGSWQIIPYVGEKDMLCKSLEQDAALALTRIIESERACYKYPANEGLAVYTRGNCKSVEGRRLSKVRWVK